ncbi:MAG: gamma-glutamyltransferase family protein [Gemmatimonadales bacterium]|nr:MAG: gamma-glutamyltransferase family protein [Gemmatimonadales bacterium]
MSSALPRRIPCRRRGPGGPGRAGAVLTLLVASAMTGVSGCEAADEAVERAGYQVPPQPEISTGYTEKPGWTHQEWAVAAAHPLAADAGHQILEAGGTAVDAAIAVQMVLTLVEPQSSGIGGGAFLLHLEDGQVTAFNGRETAPAAADEDLFLDDDGEPLPFGDAVASGRSVGVPGTLAMLQVAHLRHGRLNWAELFQPAIILAREGFEISPRLHAIVDGDDALRRDPIGGAFWFDEEGNAHPPGHLLRNPALAQVLEIVAEEGVEPFYRGHIAADIVDRVQGHGERPGLMVLEDLAAYPELPVEVDPICSPLLGATVCGFPPPSSGHLAVAQILGILEALEGGDAALAEDGLPGPEWMHLYAEASRLAWADRDEYVGDPDFVAAPAGSWTSLLDEGYLARRAELVGDASMGTAEPGQPGGTELAWSPHPWQEEGGTSHLSIVDGEGRAVAMTMTIEQGLGSRIMSDGGTGLEGGFLLNNELTDFARVPAPVGEPRIANRVEGGKRPRSSMSPTLVLDSGDGSFLAATGSPGGAAIIHYTAQSLLGMLQWDLHPQAATDLPNFAVYNSPAVLLESGRFPTSFREALEARGHDVRQQGLASGVHSIMRGPDGWLLGGADPRREGIVAGR